MPKSRYTDYTCSSSESRFCSSGESHDSTDYICSAGESHNGESREEKNVSYTPEKIESYSDLELNKNKIDESIKDLDLNEKMLKLKLELAQLNISSFENKENTQINILNLNFWIEKKENLEKALLENVNNKKNYVKQQNIIKQIEKLGKNHNVKSNKDRTRE
ncbi:MAG: hypothetical protein WCR30_03015 [Clostridia bacterium]